MLLLPLLLFLCLRLLLLMLLLWKGTGGRLVMVDGLLLLLLWLLLLLLLLVTTTVSKRASMPIPTRSPPPPCETKVGVLFLSFRGRCLVSASKAATAAREGETERRAHPYIVEGKRRRRTASSIWSAVRRQGIEDDDVDEPAGWGSTTQLISSL